MKPLKSTSVLIKGATLISEAMSHHVAENLVLVYYVMYSVPSKKDEASSTISEGIFVYHSALIQRGVSQPFINSGRGEGGQLYTAVHPDLKAKGSTVMTKLLY